MTKFTYPELTLRIESAQCLPPDRISQHIGAIAPLVDASDQPAAGYPAHVWVADSRANRRREPAAIDHLERAAVEAHDFFGHLLGDAELVMYARE